MAKRKTFKRSLRGTVYRSVFPKKSMNKRSHPKIVTGPHLKNFFGISPVYKKLTLDLDLHIRMPPAGVEGTYVFDPATDGQAYPIFANYFNDPRFLAWSNLFQFVQMKGVTVSLQRLYNLNMQIRSTYPDSLTLIQPSRLPEVAIAVGVGLINPLPTFVYNMNGALRAKLMQESKYPPSKIWAFPPHLSCNGNGTLSTTTFNWGSREWLNTTSMRNWQQTATVIQPYVYLGYSENPATTNDPTAGGDSYYKIAHLTVDVHAIFIGENNP